MTSETSSLPDLNEDCNKWEETEMGADAVTSIHNPCSREGPRRDAKEKEKDPDESSERTPENKKKKVKKNGTKGP